MTVVFTCAGYFLGVGGGYESGLDSYSWKPTGALPEIDLTLEAGELNVQGWEWCGHGRVIR